MHTIARLERELADARSASATNEALVGILRGELEEAREANTLLELRLQAMQKRELELVSTIDTQASQLKGLPGGGAASGGKGAVGSRGPGGGLPVGAGGSYAARATRLGSAGLPVTPSAAGGGAAHPGGPTFASVERDGPMSGAAAPLAPGLHVALPSTPTTAGGGGGGGGGAPSLATTPHGSSGAATRSGTPLSSAGAAVLRR
jgi:hypothetical protein